MPTINGGRVRTVVIAGDDSAGSVDRAGGTSVTMLATDLRKRLARQTVTVVQAPVGALPPDADVIVAPRGIADRVRAEAPTSVLVTVQVFLGDPAITAMVAAIRDGTDLHG
jgi:mannitol-specific phosphotransferase system IIBC component